MRMSPKCPIGGSGDAGAAEALEHGVEMEVEVADIASKLSLHPDIVESVELPQPEAEFHTDSDDDSSDESDDHSGDDSDDHSSDDSEDDGQLVSHLYPFMCQIDPRVCLVTPGSPFWNRNPMVMFSQSMKSE